MRRGGLEPSLIRRGPLLLVAVVNRDNTQMAAGDLSEIASMRRPVGANLGSVPHFRRRLAFSFPSDYNQRFARSRRHQGCNFHSLSFFAAVPNWPS
jgi:hypothetical protein